MCTKPQIASAIGYHCYVQSIIIRLGWSVACLTCVQLNTFCPVGTERAAVKKQDSEGSFEASKVTEKGGSIKVKFKRLKKADS